MALDRDASKVISVKPLAIPSEVARPLAPTVSIFVVASASPVELLFQIILDLPTVNLALKSPLMFGNPASILDGISPPLLVFNLWDLR